MNTGHADYLAEIKWAMNEMPVRIAFFLGEEAVLRQWLRGDFPNELDLHRPGVQVVIVQGTSEQERVIAAMSNLKHRRGKLYGGALAERYQP